MTTLVLDLSVQMAVRLSHATDKLGLASNQDCALRAIGELLDRELGKVRGREPQTARAHAEKRKRR